MFGAKVTSKVACLEGGGNQGKNWIFTVFGTGEDDDARLVDTKAAFVTIKDVWKSDITKVLAMQIERCSTTNKPHVQGVVKFVDNWRRSKLFSTTGRRFWCERPRSFEDAVLYCQKDDTFIGDIEYRYMLGEVVKSKQGARSDIEAMVHTVQRMCIEVNPVSTTLYTDDEIIKQVIASHPDVYLKYGTRVEQIIRLSREKVCHAPPPVWHKWQRELLEKLEAAPDDREILFCVDEAGGAGKSTLVRYLMGKGMAMSLTGTVANMSHIVTQNQHIKVWVFDVTRSCAENTKHLLSMAEGLKNSICINTKYHTHSTLLRKCHVVFFVNELPAGVRTPDAEGRLNLSQDRVTVWNVYKDGFDVLYHRGETMLKGFKPVDLALKRKADLTADELRSGYYAGPAPGEFRFDMKAGEYADAFRVGAGAGAGAGGFQPATLKPAEERNGY